MHLQKLVLVHALSGFGHSTMSVILPVVSAMGIQGCPLPTAVFSNHTGFPNWHKVDLTDEMTASLDAWDQLSLTFDGIYSGYLGSGKQAEIVLDLVKRHPESTFFLDPVMGDHGRLYSAITPEHVAAMKELTHHASYIIPNMTEACVLTDTVYREDFTADDIYAIMEKLHAMGPKHIVITGIHEEDSIANYFSSCASIAYKAPVTPNAFASTGITVPAALNESAPFSSASPSIDSDSKGRIALPIAGASRPGTGDIFGSVLISCILKGQPLEQSVLKAARFVSDCIKTSDLHHLPTIVGTCFEQVLPELWEHG